MSSIRDQIVAAIVSALGVSGAPGSVDQSRLEQYTDDQLPAFNVFPGKDEKLVATSDDEGRKLIVHVECLAAGATKADHAVDPLYVWAVQKIMADPTLGGLATFTCHEDDEWTLAWSEKDIVALKVSFSVEYRTARTDPTVKTS